MNICFKNENKCLKSIYIICCFKDVVYVITRSDMLNSKS